MKISPSTITIEKIIGQTISKHRKGDYSVEPDYNQQESSLPNGLTIDFNLA
jgi:hypothetical protein